MALKAVVIKASPVLAGLTDEQVAAIEQLSQNDENTVIGARIGELHGQYDTDVLTVTGVAKNQGEKSYDYVKRVLGDFKAKADSSKELQNKITGLEAKVTEYKTLIDSGKGNEEIAQRLKDTEKKLTDAQKLYETDKAAWEVKYKTLDAEYQNSLIDAEFGKALQGIKFKSIYPENVQKTLIDAAKRNILTTAKADWQEDNGVRKMVFRDTAGNIMNNPKNNLNPFTAGELLTQQLADVIDTGRGQGGAGTGGAGGAGGSGNLLDMTGVTTQVMADEKIQSYLMAQGFTRGSREFADKQIELRQENGVDNLPVQ